LPPLINTLSGHQISDVGLLTHPLTTSTIGLGPWTYHSQTTQTVRIRVVVK